MNPNYHLIPLGNMKARLHGTDTMTKEEVREHLKNFFIVAIDEMLCKTPIERQLVMFNKKQKRIGISGFNIPCKLTTESESDEIKKALEHFYSRLAHHQKHNRMR